METKLEWSKMQRPSRGQEIRILERCLGVTLSRTPSERRLIELQALEVPCMKQPDKAVTRRLWLIKLGSWDIVSSTVDTCKEIVFRLQRYPESIYNPYRDYLR